MSSLRHIEQRPANKPQMNLSVRLDMQGATICEV